MLLNELKSVRRSAGWSQRTLAGRIGVDAQVVKRLEQGVGSVQTLVAVMKALSFRLTGIAPGATLPEQLRARRLARSMSLDRAAARTGLSPTTVASVERGGGSIASLLKMMSVLAPKARRRAPERSFWGEGDREDRDNRFTPPTFLAAIYTAFGPIDLDPCGHRNSPVVAGRLIVPNEGGDGLVDAWTGDVVFMNPPFSALLPWLRRANDQWRAGNVKTVVCLVPVRTDSVFFHQTLAEDADLYLLKGRVRFMNDKGKEQPTPFSLMIVVFGGTTEQKARYAALTPGMWIARESESFRV